MLKPQIDGDWWQIAANPDLGAFNTEAQEPVDFAIWQAQDGTWQLWSCIRKTGCGGKGRLFYRWEGRQLEAEHWTPMGIAMQANPELGEQEGGLQAPHVIREGDTYYMFYGDYDRICLATSSDGKRFTRGRNEKGQPNLFQGPYDNTRDPMVLKVGDTYHCYYTGHSRQALHKSAVFCRTSGDLLHWSPPVKVSAGGVAETQADFWGGDSECPFVVQLDDLYCLFRNQRYGKHSLNTQYCSPDPLYFGVDDDRYRVGTLPVAAPEIVRGGPQYYIASLLPGLDGIRLAKLAWVPV